MNHPFWPLWFTKDVFLWLERWDRSFLLQTMTDTVCRDLVQENRRQRSVCKDKITSRSVSSDGPSGKKTCKERCSGGEDGSFPSLHLSRGLTMKPWQELQLLHCSTLTFPSLFKSVETPGNWPGRGGGGGGVTSSWPLVCMFLHKTARNRLHVGGAAPSTVGRSGWL